MIKLMKSTFYHEDVAKEALAEFILHADMLSMGKECKKFENNFALKQGRKHAMFVSSGSMANLVLIQALLNLERLKKEDKVAVSSLTWATNIMPIIQLGLTPVALDCERETLNVSSNIIQQSAGCQNIKALFLTNVLGYASDIGKIRDWCSDNGVLLLEDNCESLGSQTEGKMLGNFGLASTFSTFVGHHFSTVEGGMICTDDDDLHDMLLMVRAHGWDRNISVDKQIELREKHGVDDFFARYTFYDLAFNARPTEISGFLGNQQLSYWDEIVDKRQKNFERFQKATETNDELLPLNVQHMDVVSNFAMPIVCKTTELFEKYRAKFESAHVEIRPIIAGDMTKQPFFRKYSKDSPLCKNADFVHKNGFYFPNNPELTEEEVALLCQLLQK
jgi:CDP-6-deoxy-D-xylo-4-hexulose-3-dehydrase